jgi:hypothetical protein
LLQKLLLLACSLKNRFPLPRYPKKVIFIMTFRVFILAYLDAPSSTDAGEVPELSSVFLAAVSVLGVEVTMPLESTTTTST